MLSELCPKHIFCGSNTEKGFISYYDELFNDLEIIYIIEGCPGCGKSTLMKGIAENAENKGLNVIYGHCSSDPLSLDAVIIPALSLAVADGTAPHPVKRIFPCAREITLNLGEFVDCDFSHSEKEKYYAFAKEKQALYKKLYNILNEEKNKSNLISITPDKNKWHFSLNAYGFYGNYSLEKLNYTDFSVCEFNNYAEFEKNINSDYKAIYSYKSGTTDFVDTIVIPDLKKIFKYKTDFNNAVISEVSDKIRRIHFEIEALYSRHCNFEQITKYSNEKAFEIIEKGGL